MKLLSILAVLLTIHSLPAQELLPADRPIESVIDHYIDAKLKKNNIKPAAPASEPTLVRRLTLDLAGRIPTPTESQEYLSSKDTARKTKLIDRLMTSPEYVHHAATEFDAMLAGETDRAPSVRNYLLAALRENRPWDQMFRELLGVRPAAERPEAFVLGRLKDLDDITRDASSIFFGLNITCAQCHKHPYVDSITQDYFHGMKLFFARSIDFNGQLMEREFAKMEYKNKKGMVFKAKLIFLSGTLVDEPLVKVADLGKAIQEESKKIEELKKAKTKELPQKPAFSYREQLANVALKPTERERFARAIVNRLWHRFYGYGLVMRLDQMHTENPPSHPELLDWLARDLIAHNFDLKRLVRSLVSSNAYARSSRWDQPGDPPGPDTFAVAQVRLLTPMQYAMSQMLAADPGLLPKTANPEFERYYDDLEAQAKKIFGRLIERPRDGLQINVTEALLLSNDLNLLKVQGGKLVANLTKLEDRRQQVDQAVWAVLSRPATEEEVSLLSDYVTREEANLPELSPVERKQRQEKRAIIEKARAQASQLEASVAKLKTAKDKTQRDKLEVELAQVRKTADLPLPIVSPFESRRAQALHQMVWALLNSPAFRFNH